MKKVMDLSVKMTKNILGGENSGCSICDCSNCPKADDGYDMSKNKSKGKSDGYKALGA